MFMTTCKWPHVGIRDAQKENCEYIDYMYVLYAKDRTSNVCKAFFTAFDVNHLTGRISP